MVPTALSTWPASTSSLDSRARQCPTALQHLFYLINEPAASTPCGRLLGTVDLSIQELQLPSHAIAGGLYLSHMAVAAEARRRGIGRELLREASACAARRGEECIYLHVEPQNAAAIGLYEASGFDRQRDGVAPFAGFTLALNLQDRAVLYKLDGVSSRESSLE